MQTPRQRHKHRRAARINAWLKQARDGIRITQDGRTDEESPSVRFEGVQD